MCLHKGAGRQKHEAGRCKSEHEECRTKASSNISRLLAAAQHAKARAFRRFIF
jgi:hypothetical protein